MLDENIDFTEEDYKEMLSAIAPPADYTSWLRVIIAAKAAGLSYEIVDEWNQQDPEKYNSKENLRKWNSITVEGGISPATLVHLATEAGWNARKKPKSILNVSTNLGEGHTCGIQESDIGYRQYSSKVEEEKVVAALGALAPREVKPLYSDEPKEEVIRFIKEVYRPSDTIRIVTSARLTSSSDEKEKWSLGNAGFTILAKDLIEKLSSSETIEDAIGEYNHHAGVWIGFNPIQTDGSKDCDITDFRYFLVECDELPVELQLAQLQKSRLPISIIVYSGNKSLHALVRCPEGIKTVDEYKAAAKKLFADLEALGMHPDKCCSNPSRLTRLPGVERGNNQQFLVSTSIGASSYEEWTNLKDLLSANEKIDELYGAPVQLSSMDRPGENEFAWVVDGLVRQGQLTEIIGKSKAGKSLFTLQMCISVATGNSFLGRDCQKRRVLYCNLEISEFDMQNRTIDALEALQLTHSDIQDLLVWNLRGKEVQLDNFIEALITKAKVENIGLVVIDPIYMLLNGIDENDNSGTAIRFGKLQRFMSETNCSVIIVHHESDKSTSNLPSGASTFLRAYDTMIHVDKAIIPFNLPRKYVAGEVAYRMTVGSRNNPQDPIAAWRNGTVFFPDTTGVLQFCDLDTSGGASKKDLETLRKAAIDKLNAEN